MKTPALRRDSNTFNPAPIRVGRSAAATSGGKELLEAAQEIKREQEQERKQAQEQRLGRSQPLSLSRTV